MIMEGRRIHHKGVTIIPLKVVDLGVIQKRRRKQVRVGVKSR
jgi:hypothetical protein